MNVYWPLFRSECHRRFEATGLQGQSLANELDKLGVNCHAHFEEGRKYDLIFLCGTHWSNEEHMQKCFANIPEVPVVWYCWDIYPLHVEEAMAEETRKSSPRSSRGAVLFRSLIARGKACKRILVPSRCSVKNITNIVGRDDAQVVLGAVHPFVAPNFRDSGFVLDAMRKYDDLNEGAVARACFKLKIPCIGTMSIAGWEEYVDKLSSCRLLVSAYRVASTGGYSALEAYALGKQVLLSDSPDNGAVDYFGHGRPGVQYFNWESPGDLRRRIIDMFNNPHQPNLRERIANFHWVKETYSDAKMADGLAAQFRAVAKE